MKFGREGLKKNKSLVKEVEALQKTVNDENAAWQDVEKELTELKDSVASSDALVAKLGKFEKSLKTLRDEVASLKEQVARADIEKTISDKLVTDVFEQSEQRMIRRNVAIAGLN